MVHAFVSGQLIAALLFAVFTAVLPRPGRSGGGSAGGDRRALRRIPVLGILLATVPAVLLALTVSPAPPSWCWCLPRYHLFETYFLLPRIYGNKLRISTLSVLLALIVGGRLQGIIGAVLVLPVVAAYPIIERHWLGRFLRSRVLTDHEALAKAAETGNEVAIDAVLLGRSTPPKGPPDEDRGPSRRRGAGPRDRG